MDSTVIQEIANQLGIAVDQAGQFITENLPEFAAMKIVQLEVPLITVWVVFAVFLIIAVISFAVLSYFCKHDALTLCREIFIVVFSAATAIAIVALIIAVIMTGCNVPQIIGWQEYPQAMLIDMALKEVG